MTRVIQIGGGVIGAAIGLLFLALIAGAVIRAQVRPGCHWKQAQQAAGEVLTCPDGSEGGKVEEAPHSEGWEGFAHVWTTVAVDGTSYNWLTEREAQRVLEAECH